MKKTNWFVLALFAVASAALRVWQLRTGFDEANLAVRGNLPGLLLPFVLVAAALYFCLAARKLPAQRDVTGEITEHFLFQDMTAAFCAVAGAFLLLGSAVAAVVGYARSLRMVPVAALAVVSGLCLLYLVFAFYRGKPVQSLALLVPVVSLVAYLIVLYRIDAANPVLARVYIELLAVAALTLAALELAAFAFLGGAPRAFIPASAMALVLSLTAAAERQSLAATLLFAGCALVDLGFLAAADMES